MKTIHFPHPNGVFKLIFGSWPLIYNFHLYIKILTHFMAKFYVLQSSKLFINSFFTQYFPIFSDF